VKKRHKLTRHHRLPTSIGGKNDESNISFISEYQHSAWHAIASNHSAPTIGFILNEKFLDPAYKFVCVPTGQFEKVTKIVAQLT